MFTNLNLNLNKACVLEINYELDMDLESLED